jgi:hypothetical protein
VHMHPLSVLLEICILNQRQIDTQDVLKANVT